MAQLDESISHEEYQREFIAPRRCTSLADFLTRAPRGFQLMQDEAALALVVEDVFQQLAADGVIYAEIRFAPLLHIERGLTPEQVVAAVDRATEACIRSSGIEARLILCTLRHFDQEQSLETARLVEQFRGSRVAALDIAGDEAGFRLMRTFPRSVMRSSMASIEPLMPARRAARTAFGKRCASFNRRGSAMACEASKTPKLMEHLKRERIHLEVCPTSNSRLASREISPNMPWTSYIARACRSASAPIRGPSRISR